MKSENIIFRHVPMDRKILSYQIVSASLDSGLHPDTSGPFTRLS